MEPSEILRIALQPGEPPVGWTVIPINRENVRRSIFGWTLASLLGFGLMAVLLSFIFDVFSVFSLPFLFILIMGFLGIGSAYLVVKKIRVLSDADHHLIVLTPDLYVQRTGAKVTAVPLTQVSNVTLRGVFGGSMSSKLDDTDVKVAAMSANQFFGGRQLHRTRRTPDSLAFVDARDGSIVTVAEDNSFAPLEVLEEYLRQYTDGSRSGGARSDGSPRVQRA